MDIRFDNKTVVITGGAGGIGFAIAEMMVESGAKVAIVDLVAEEKKDLLEKLQAKGTAKGYNLNLSKVSGIPAVIEAIRKDLGEIDVLVQAAGLLAGSPAVEITEENWDTVLNVNAKGLFFMMKEVVKQSMIPSGNGGSIVNFASMAGIRGMVEPMCSAHYSASKGAVVAMTMQAAVEWAKHGVRANAVAPGGVNVGGMKNMPPEHLEKVTAPVPLKKLSEAEDIASGVCFLASSAAQMVTGQTLVIDGGSCIVGY